MKELEAEWNESRDPTRVSSQANEEPVVESPQTSPVKRRQSIRQEQSKQKNDERRSIETEEGTKSKGGRKKKGQQKKGGRESNASTEGMLTVSLLLAQGKVFTECFRETPNAVSGRCQPYRASFGPTHFSSSFAIRIGSAIHQSFSHATNCPYCP